MSLAPPLIGLLLAVGMATSACAAPKPGPALHCRHVLDTSGSPDGLPPAIVAQLKPWMALHGESWNATDSISRGQLTASFLWLARGSGDWIVAYGVGGITCCQTRLALFTPTPSGFHWVTPPRGGPDDFGDATCKGIDAVLDAYGTRPWR